MPTRKPKIVVVVGPTASGKTDLAIHLAKQFSGEVISADSRQVYRGIDLASGKVTAEEMGGIPHHLLSIADPRERYTAADFASDADAAITEIIARKNLPIIAGGTFLYVDALLGRIQTPFVEPNQELRTALESQSTDELFEELSEQDPDRAATIDRHNRRRLIRALEIVDSLGTVPKQAEIDSPYDSLMIGIKTDPDILRDSIRSRIITRIEAGMIDEVAQLHKNGVSWERFEELGLECRYIARHLQGDLTEDELVETLTLKTKQFAKRQMTWLKRDPLITWFNPTDIQNIEQAVTAHIQDTV